jgi:hypothetical protein
VIDPDRRLCLSDMPLIDQPRWRLCQFSIPSKWEPLTQTRQNNILIDSDGVPKLADFGLSRVLVEANFSRWRTTYSTQGASTVKGTLRWMPPERIGVHNDFDPDAAEQSTKAGDIYAYGMVALVCCNLLTSSNHSTLISTSCLTGGGDGRCSVLPIQSRFPSDPSARPWRATLTTTEHERLVMGDSRVVLGYQSRSETWGGRDN